MFSVGLSLDLSSICSYLLVQVFARQYGRERDLSVFVVAQVLSYAGWNPPTSSRTVIGRKRKKKRPFRTISFLSPRPVQSIGVETSKKWFRNCPKKESPSDDERGIGRELTDLSSWEIDTICPHVMNSFLFFPSRSSINYHVRAPPEKLRHRCRDRMWGSTCSLMCHRVTLCAEMTFVG